MPGHGIWASLGDVVSENCEWFLKRIDVIRAFLGYPWEGGLGTCCGPCNMGSVTGTGEKC